MADLNEEKISRILSHLLAGKRGRTSRADCLAEEELALYLGGALPEDLKQRMELHLAECNYCLDEIVAVHKATLEGDTEEVPQRILERLMALVPHRQKEENLLELVVRLAKESLELVSTSGQLVLTPVPASVRSETRSSGPRMVQVKKQMGGFGLLVEVEVLEPGLCQIVVNVNEESGKPADGVRITLVSAGREQASYLARQGQIVFDRVPQGEYNLAISDLGAPIGTVRLAVVEGQYEGERSGP